MVRICWFIINSNTIANMGIWYHGIKATVLFFEHQQQRYSSALRNGRPHRFFFANRQISIHVPLWPAAGLIQKESLACYSVSGHRPQWFQWFQLWMDWWWTLVDGLAHDPLENLGTLQLLGMGQTNDMADEFLSSPVSLMQFKCTRLLTYTHFAIYCPCRAGLRVPLCHLCCCKIAIGDSFLRSHVQWWMRWNEKHLPKSRSHRKSIGDTVHTVYHCRPFERNDFPTKFIGHCTYLSIFCVHRTSQSHGSWSVLGHSKPSSCCCEGKRLGKI